MREDSKNNHNDLHWHNGGTCHGTPTLEECVKRAIRNCWIGKVLKIEDEYRDGTKVSCYSLICDYFENHGKRGTYVAVVEVTSRLL